MPQRPGQTAFVAFGGLPQFHVKRACSGSDGPAKCFVLAGAFIDTNQVGGEKGGFHVKLGDRPGHMARC